MSEKIKITVVLQNEKINMEKMPESVKKMILTHDTSMTIMSTLLKNRLMEGGFCGGRGDCGRCMVQFLEGAPLPTGVERSHLSPMELRQGYRLACMARPKGDCVVRIVTLEEADIKIVTEVRLPSENIDLDGRKKYLSENQKSDAMKKGTDQTAASKNAIKRSSAIYNTEADVMKNVIEVEKAELKKDACYVIAVDLGTTTIAMQLRNMETGAVADTYCVKNPQRSYGTDVLSRIQASCAGHREELRGLVCETLLCGLNRFINWLREKEEALSSVSEMDSGQGLKRIACMCIAGNTTMEHLLMGYDVEALGKAPFLPTVTVLQKIEAAHFFRGMEDQLREKMAETSLAVFDFPVYLVPCISAFVGGDIVAGLYALRMSPVYRTQNGQVTLLIDLGTNGEMAITDGNRMIVTATAAGPAFEGDGGLIGTDRIAFTAKLLRRGILDETGLLTDPYFTTGVFIEQDEEEIARKESGRYFKQEDVRTLQMAKAAVRAGVEVLWDAMGQPEIRQVYLAGGFGYYLNVEAAFCIGLLPSCLRGKVRAAGNTSLEGAYELGCDLYREEVKAEAMEETLSSVISINLARQENFEELYLKYMNLEKN